MFPFSTDADVIAHLGYSFMSVEIMWAHLGSVITGLPTVY